MKTALICAMGLVMTAGTLAAQDDVLPEGKGKEVVVKTCQGCHSLKVIAAKKATKEQWNNIVQQMVSRGADASDADIVVIVDYLSTAFPPAATDAPPADKKAAPPAGGTSSLRTPDLLTVSNSQWKQMLAHYQGARSAN